MHEPAVATLAASTGIQEPASVSFVLTLATAIGLIVSAVIVLVLINLRQRSYVASTSTALRQLRELNEKAQPHVAAQAAIRSAFRIRVESKGKFDRFDLSRFMTTSVMEHESWFEAQTVSRLRALELFRAYEVSVARLAKSSLGTTTHPHLAPHRFAAIEQRLFCKRQLTPPFPTAEVSAIIVYTSPMGRNSYSRRLDWDFDALCQGLRIGQEMRARQSTAEALRARERSLMTPALRVDVLRRDDFRCKMCGASRDDGVALHVDHITPVSRGGRTLLQNLQTLCQPCNTGKSNRFVG